MNDSEIIELAEEFGIMGCRPFPILGKPDKDGIMRIEEPSGVTYFGLKIIKFTRKLLEMTNEQM